MIACAIKLAQKGINIFGVYLRRPKDQIEALTTELESYGVKVVFKKMSATNAEKRAEAMDDLKTFGEIRVKVFVHSLAFGALKLAAAPVPSAKVAIPEPARVDTAPDDITI